MISRSALAGERSRADVPRAASAVATEWHHLAVDGDSGAFELGQLAGTPAGVQRWISAAVAPGSGLTTPYRFEMTGEIKLNATWRSFRAVQLSSRSGYIWAASLRVAGLPVHGYDRFTAANGEMRWRLFGLIPLVTATGQDISRSAAGRLAAEVVLTPTSYADAEWVATEDPEVVEGTFDYPTGPECVSVRISAAGDPVAVSMRRWGDPASTGVFAEYPFGGELSEHRTFGDVRIPTAMRIGWWPGTARWETGEFFRATISELTR